MPKSIVISKVYKFFKYTQYLCFSALAIIILLKSVSTIETDFLDTTEFPLQSVNSIAQDKNGRIYLGLDDLSRIQVYDGDGRFLRSWFVDTDSGGGWEFKIDDEDVIHTLGSGMYSRYNIDGVLLHKEYVWADREEYFNVKLTRLYNSCENLIISRDSIYNFVIRRKDSNQVIIKTPWYLLLFNVPVPAVLYVVYSLIYGFITIPIEYRKEKEFSNSLGLKQRTVGEDATIAFDNLLEKISSIKNKGNPMKYNKVLLTQFAIPNFYTLEYTSNVHLAPGYLVGYVKHDFPGIEFIITPRIYTDLLSEEAFVKYAVEQKPDLMLFSLYLWNIEKSLRVVDKIQKLLPETKFLFGGPEVNPDNRFLLETEQFSYGIVGEGEIAFKDYLSGKDHSEIAGFLTKDSYNDFKTLRTDYSVRTNPYLAELIETRPDETMFFETVRGCPFNCSFCYYNKVYDKIIPVGFNHLEEIFDFARSHDFKELFILDPTFNFQPNFEEILDKLIILNSDHHFKISTELRADFLTDEQIEKLRRINLVEAEIGLQTTNEKALDLMGRSRRISETIERTKKMQEAGITCKVDLIIGLPGDSLAGFKKSIDAVDEANIADAIQVFRLALLSGTDFSKRKKELGLTAQAVPPYYLESTPTFSKLDIREALEYTDAKLDISLYPIPAYLLSTDFSELDQKFVEFDSETTPIHKIVFENPIFDVAYLQELRYRICESLVLHFMINPEQNGKSRIIKIINWFTENFPHNVFQFILEFKGTVDKNFLDEVRKNIPANRSSYLNRDSIANLGADLNLTAALAIIAPQDFLDNADHSILKEETDLFIKVDEFCEEFIDTFYDDANFLFSGKCQKEAFNYLKANDLLDDYTLFESFRFELKKSDDEVRIYYPNCVKI